MRKYKLATERGMGPANNAVPAKRDKTTSGPSKGVKETPAPTPTESPSADSMDPPPRKRPRLKLNVKPPKSSQSLGDTIAVSRPKRQTARKTRYSEDAAIADVDKSADQRFTAPSSDLSPLSSAPRSERNESPFRDPTPAPAQAEYGDFMSYYVAGGDDETAAKSQAKPKGQSQSTAKAKKEAAKTVKQPTPPQTQPLAKPAPPVPSASHAPPPQQQVQGPPLPPQQSQRQSQPPRQGHVLQYQAVPQHLPPALPPQRPFPPMPRPIIQFIDIVYDARPATTDKIAVMILKLEELSSALTQFGGVPAMPNTPPQPKPAKPVSKERESTSADPLDSFLMHFGDDDDDESDDRNVEYDVLNPGAPDTSLIYGIQFIQNALKSWAQQRMTHQVTTQLQLQHQQHMQWQHVQSQRRGPGRPRKYEDPHPLMPLNAVIHMDMANTPEGVAIKAFQTVIDSGCLQVNAIIPKELSRALRHLYMQIDHLINQGPKREAAWQCMSYAAQISAHKNRVCRWKEAQAKAQEGMVHQQQVVTQMGLQPHQMNTLSQGQLQHHHALEVERRRSLQHAVQQPYISEQHLNPLELGSRPSECPSGAAPVPDNVLPSATPHIATPPASSNSRGTPSATQELLNGSALGANQVPSAFIKAGTGQVQLDKMKLYMPGFLPRSGQSMKFSFAPQNEAAVRAFGQQAFPVNEQGPNLPNRGPMSAPPSQPLLSNGDTMAPGGDANSPIDLDPETTGDQASSSNGAQPVPVAPALAQGGLTAVNRPSSMPAGSPGAGSPDTIQVAMRRPYTIASASTSPAPVHINPSYVKRGVLAPTNFPAPPEPMMVDW